MKNFLKKIKALLMPWVARMHVFIKDVDHERIYSHYPPSPRERILMENLRKESRSFPVMSIMADAPPALKKWLRNVGQLRDHIVKRDPRGFSSWDVVSSNMVHEPRAEELAAFKRLKSWSAWQDIIKSQPPLSPHSLHAERMQGNLIHNAYMIALSDSYDPLDIPNLRTIVEFGGGYGGMCQLFFRAGFRGTYVIFDFPDFLSLQRYYLDSTMIDLAPSLRSDSSSGVNEVVFVSTPADLKKTLDNVGQIDVCIASWSLSEAPLQLRHEFLQALPTVERYLFAYQKAFGEVDNLAFFDGLRKEKSDHTWVTLPIGHLPDHYYAFGKK